MNKLNKIESILFTFIFSFLLIGFALAHLDLLLYEGSFVREDGPVEWLTVLALMLGAITCFVRCFKLKKQRSLIFLLALFGLGCLFIFGAGEEISWGQRIFGINSPHFFIEHNSQQELNVHNLILSGVKINKLFFGTLLGIAVATYLLILPFMYKKGMFINDWVNKLAIPVPRYRHTIAYALLFFICEMIPSGKSGEMLEFGGCFIFVLILWFPQNKQLFTKD